MTKLRLLAQFWSPTAWVVAATVSGLVFVDGSFLGSDLQLAMKSIKGAIDRAGMDAFTQRFFSDMFLESGDPELRERLIARAQGLNARFREELFLDLVRWDATKLRDALRRISVPVLVLQSTYMDTDLKRVSLPLGQTTPWMNAVASLVQHSHARVIPNAGHMTMIEAAPAVNGAIEEFCSYTLAAGRQKTAFSALRRYTQPVIHLPVNNDYISYG